MDLMKLISWLETKPPDETYTIGPGGCALQQWVCSMGIPESYQIALELGGGPLGEVAGVWHVDAKRTFGAMLERAKAMVCEEQKLAIAIALYLTTTQKQHART